MATEQPEPIAKNTRQRWYQFTLARVLGATFWMAVFFGGVAFANATPMDAIPEYLGMALGIALPVIPFVAIGTLFGDAGRGLLIGLILLVGGSFVMSVLFETVD